MKKYLVIFILFMILPFLSLGNNVYADDLNYDSNYHNHGDFLDFEDAYRYCGGDSKEKALIKNVPKIIPQITSAAYDTVLVIVPLILVVMGSIDLFRGSISQNEDEIKKGKTNFMKRLATGVLTFLIVLLVKFFVSAMSKDQTRIISCINCFVNNECSISNDYNSGIPGEEAPKSNSNTSSNTNSTNHSSSGGKF